MKRRIRSISSSNAPSVSNTRRTSAATWIVGSVFALAIVAIIAVSSGIFTGLPIGGNRCQDSDGGKNYDVFGIVTYFTQHREDVCRPDRGAKVLQEYYCSRTKAGWSVKSVFYNCPNACKNGACVSGNGTGNGTGGSPVCGNNIKEQGEQCDGNDLGSETCSSLGFIGGTLRCTPTCVFDASQCTTSGGNGTGNGTGGGGNTSGFCGNGVCDATESVISCQSDCAPLTSNLKKLSNELVSKHYPTNLVWYNGKIYFSASTQRQPAVGDDMWLNNIWKVNPDGTSLSRTDYRDVIGKKELISFSISRDGYFALHLAVYNGLIHWPSKIYIDKKFLTDGSYPYFSPDGRKVIFDSGNSSSSSIHYLYKINTNGSGRFSFNLKGYNPIWSPNGEKIIFVQNGIWIMNSDGSGRNRIYGSMPYLYGINNGFQMKSWASWSPDGGKIVFSDGGIGGKTTIYVMNSDGSNKFKLIGDALNEYYSPAWSLDGKKIAFVVFDGSTYSVSGKNGVYSTPIINLYVVDVTTLS